MLCMVILSSLVDFAEKEFAVCHLNVVELMCVLDDSVVLCGQADFR